MIQQIVRICDVDGNSLKIILILRENFLNFWFDTVEKQNIINLGQYGSKGDALVILVSSEVIFLGEKEDAAFLSISPLCFGIYSVAVSEQ